MDEKDLLEKIDELKNELNDVALTENTNQTNIANIKEKIGALESKVGELTDKLSTNKDEIIKGVKEEFVKYVEFEPVKTLVYGLVGGVLLAVLFAVLALVIIPTVHNISTDPAFLPSVVKSHNGNGQ